VRLALLVAGTMLPLIIFAVGIVFNNYEQDRREATQRVLDTVRSIRLVLDAEMQRMTGGSRFWRSPIRCATATSTAFAALRRGFSINMARMASCWWRTTKAACCFPR